MSQPLNLFGSFSEPIVIDDQLGLVTIHPEMYPAKAGIAPSGRYYIHMVHPERGTCTFVIEQNEHSAWLSEHHPPFIDQAFIDWLGTRIEQRPA